MTARKNDHGGPRWELWAMARAWVLIRAAGAAGWVGVAGVWLAKELRVEHAKRERGGSKILYPFRLMRHFYRRVRSGRSPRAA